MVERVRVDRGSFSGDGIAAVVEAGGISFALGAAFLDAAREADVEDVGTGGDRRERIAGFGGDG